jgi:hypothetical protein
LQYGSKDQDESCLIEDSENSFYSDDVFFIAPFFVIDRSAMKVMSVKNSLESFVKDN